MEIPPVYSEEEEKNIEGKVDPKREYLTNESTLAGTVVKSLGQLCLPSKELERASFFEKKFLHMSPHFEGSWFCHCWDSSKESQRS